MLELFQDSKIVVFCYKTIERPSSAKKVLAHSIEDYYTFNQMCRLFDKAITSNDGSQQVPAAWAPINDRTGLMIYAESNVSLTYAYVEGGVFTIDESSGTRGQDHSYDGRYHN